ncbi:hypothetical protein KGM_215898 [Danaus plexippus plexippus]|uniref:Uncharacterized protein n=1 Tax=Danaus plexippus plexippus TaxID=278856 RepID=A0A212FK94_DANPL|nr:hypothetical protein KGM_215898 [Danaus plexippus plexippus]
MYSKVICFMTLASLVWANEHGSGYSSLHISRQDGKPELVQVGHGDGKEGHGHGASYDYYVLCCLLVIAATWAHEHKDAYSSVHITKADDHPEVIRHRHRDHHVDHDDHIDYYVNIEFITLLRSDSFY